MAKRKPGGSSRRGRKTKTGRKPAAPRAAAKRARAKAASGRKVARKAPVKRRPVRTAKEPTISPEKRPRLDRVRRTLVDVVVPTPPSSLNLDRRGSAARTGRAELAEKRRDLAGMTDFAAGDPDVDVEEAYFSGEGAPGGDNPTPDQDIVDEIGKAVGIEYEDAEQLDAEKVVERDKHRWELDPASAEDYKDRK